MNSPVILFCAPYAPGNTNIFSLGASRKIETLIKIFLHIGYRVVLLDSSHDEEKYKKSEWQLLSIGNKQVQTFIPTRWPIRRLGKTINLLQARGIANEIIHNLHPNLVWIYNAYALESKVAKHIVTKIGCPLFLELEDWPLARQRDWNPKPCLDMRGLNQVLPYVTQAFAVNDVMARWLKQKKIPARLLPGIVSNSLVSRTSSRQPFANSKKITVGYFGGLSKEKGAGLIYAAATKATSEISWIITGSGPYEEDLKNLSKNNSAVHFYGKVQPDKLEQLIADCDIIINPHYANKMFRQGIFPFKALEALSTGRLFITTTLPPLKTLINLKSAIVEFNGTTKDLLTKIEIAREIYYDKVLLVNDIRKQIIENWSENALQEMFRLQILNKHEDRT